MVEVFIRFLLLGCISFGGPIAHIGYFQREFVEKRRWLTEHDFTQALSLCQFLPGPASSQLGMWIGYQRAGYVGSAAAFVGFTLPSFLLLTFAAIFSANLQDSWGLNLLISAAKLLAVVVVADAIFSMAKQFIRDKVTLLICVLSAAWVLWQTGLFAQLYPILVAGIVGALFLKTDNSENKKQQEATKPKRLGRHSVVLFLLFALCFFAPLLIAMPLTALFYDFYQAGSFVFGGGHVVLPLLEPLVGTSFSNDSLLEGYAAAQLVPGPMFTVASFLGASAPNVSPFVGSLIATLAIFLPGALLLFAVLPVWKQVMSTPRFSSSVAAINAAVVGLLLAAFYQPVWITAIGNWQDVAITVICFGLLRQFRLSVFWLLGLLICYRALFFYLS